MYRLRGFKSGAYRLLWVGVLLALLVTVVMWINCCSRKLSSGSSISRKLHSGNSIKGNSYQEDTSIQSKRKSFTNKNSVKSSSKQTDVKDGEAGNRQADSVWGQDDAPQEQTNSKEAGGADRRLAGSVWGQDGVRQEYENYDDVATADEMPQMKISDADESQEDTGAAPDYIAGGSDARSQRHSQIPAYDNKDVDSSRLDCRINDEYVVSCLRDSQQVYIPFTFINKYFEVTGQLVKEDGVEHFEWQHSHAQIYQPTDTYRPGGIFMSFEHYNVEVRNRVKCISGAEGVPVSTQWGVHGYFYPIQIAQYGLSHYSKYIIEQKSRRKSKESGRNDGDGSKRKSTDIGRSQGPEGIESGRPESPERAGLGYHLICDGQAAHMWQVSKSAKVQSVMDSETASSVIEFESSGNSEKAQVRLPISDFLTAEPITTSKNRQSLLSFSIRFTTNGSITVVVEAEVRQPKTLAQSVHLFEIHYISSDHMISTASQHIYYGIGKNATTWRTFTRDINIDLQKGLLLSFRKQRRKAPKIILRRIIRLDLRGNGFITNISISRTAHLAQFYSAADWFVTAQDSRGGWPINVTRISAPGISDLSPGWYSAMAQGQAISVLSRAFLQTKNSRYLDSALNAIKLFDVTSDDGGVLTSFSGRYPWYEEYPTNPSSFVLNGFIYSLIGLYDLKEVANGTEGGKRAEKLYRAGVSTLRALISLFDTGSGSVYDLRHFSLPGTAPNIARWDYHATHVNQLLLLATVEDSDEDRLFETVAKRWMGYMKGKHAPRQGQV